MHNAQAPATIEQVAPDERERFEAWWGQKPVELVPLEPRSEEDKLSAWVWMAWQAATLAAAKEHASLCRKERLHWKLQGQKDTRDFELCALSNLT